MAVQLGSPGPQLGRPVLEDPRPGSSTLGRPALLTAQFGGDTHTCTRAPKSLFFYLQVPLCGVPQHPYIPALCDVSPGGDLFLGNPSPQCLQPYK